MKWYVLALKKFAQFKGRSRRKEFWMFVLFNTIFSIVAMILDGAFNTKFSIAPEGIDPMLAQSLQQGYIQTFYSLFTFIPALSLSVRRLHDINKSGKWVLGYYLMLVPLFLGIYSQSFVLVGLIALAFLVFSIILLVWYCTDGTSGSNKYGSNPKDENGNMQDFGGVFADVE